ncbi:MAG: type II toxin-antitoxin system death-on-curing family toxin [Thermoanaerobaculia bacterium]
MDEPRWIPRLAVEAFHFDQIREHGGLPGVRDEDLLEAALARPRHRWAYEPAPTLPSLAASYGFGLLRNHPFHDGNKRTAFLAMVVFLGLNGLDLDAEEEDVVRTVRAAAAGQIGEDELAAWVEAHVQPL